MFVGHYGPAFVAKRLEPSIPLWLLFIAVQFLDVLWAPLVLLGIERVRIVPHFTGSNALDLYYMPFTHGLLTALAWALLVAVLYRAIIHPARWQAGVVLGAAVFSHWALDLVVHVADLPLYANTAKVGFGLWNAPLIAFAVEALILGGGLSYYLRGGARRPVGTVVFGTTLLLIQAFTTFVSPPPRSDRAFAYTALTAYVLFALVIWWIADRRPRDVRGSTATTP
ncbi:MAG TPA: hypothetical protein VFV19_13825 [Candidatus Polarisedimenticolaceae bacterium]|nr:hypothetical protein [Candidatus Polarisedimenticolaceae bacterium]